MLANEGTAAQLDDQALMASLRQVVAERLFTSVEQVRPESRLIADLRVDSLDIVDLQFVLEDRFRIRFGHGEFFDATPDWVGKDGCLLPHAVTRLSGVMPELSGLAAVGPVTTKSFLEHLTVGTLARMVRRQLDQQPNP